MQISLGPPANYLAVVRIHLTRVFASASLKLLCAGIGIAPHLPLPPFLMELTRAASASFYPLYLAATSTYAGPSTFLSTAWQAMQAFFWANARFAKLGTGSVTSTRITGTKNF